MPALPNAFSIQMGVGSQWSQAYTFQNADGSLIDLTTKTFEFVVRTDPSELTATTPLIKVTTTSGTQGVITVNTSTATATVTLSPTATAVLAQQAYPYSLWMDPGLTDATAWVTGTVFAFLIAVP